MAEVKGLLELSVIPMLEHLTNRKKSRSEGTVEKPFPFPITTIEQLVSFEKKSDSEEFRNTVEKYLMQHRGKNLKDSITRLLNHTMSTIVGKEFSWDGYQKKQPFKLLKLVQIISEVTRKQGAEWEIDVRFKSWLKSAHSEHYLKRKQDGTEEATKPKRKMKQKKLSFATLLGTSSAEKGGSSTE